MTSSKCPVIVPKLYRVGRISKQGTSVPSLIRVHLRVFAAIVALAPLVSGCSRHSSSSATAVLRYPIIQEPSTMDPTRIQDVYTNELLQNVYEGLVGLGADNRPFPQLASKWEISSDGKTYTFHIRPDARFHKPFSRPVIAEDLKYSIERSLNPATKSPTAENYLSGIEGARDVVAGKTKSLSGLKIIDPHTVAITITKPMGYFLGSFAYPTAWVVCKEAIEKNGGRLDEHAAIGTGPFLLTQYQHGGRVTLEANPEYYLGRPKLDRIDRPIVLDPQTIHLMYENGEIDAVAQPALADYVNDQKDSKLRSESKLLTQANIFYLAFQERVQPVFKDRRVRQAIAKALDREEIARISYKATSPATYSFIPPGIAGETQVMRVNAYDPAAARKLLSAAGYPNGQGFPAITVHLLEHQPEFAAMAQIIRNQLRENLSINVSIQEHEAASFWDDTGPNERLPLFLTGWVADYPDAQDFLSTLLRTGAKLNHLAYSNPAFDALCDKADSETSEAKRIPLYRKADQVAMEDAAIVPLVAYRQPMLIKPYVKGAQSNLLVFFLPHVKTSIGRK